LFRPLVILIAQLSRTKSTLSQVDELDKLDKSIEQFCPASPPEMSCCFISVIVIFADAVEIAMPNVKRIDSSYLMYSGSQNSSN